MNNVRALLRDAQPVPMVRPKESPDPSIPRNGIDAGQWFPKDANALGLPKNCPVLPLGIRDKVGWFIDPIGQLQSLEPPYGKGHILGLFVGDANFLSWAWPRFASKKAGGGIDGYAAEAVAAALINACQAKGVWNTMDKLRGRGAWLARDGGLVLHTGAKVLAGGRSERPGEIDGYVYPTGGALPLPWPGEVAEDNNPAKLLLPLLAGWNWSRPDIDPRLLLGWIGVAFLGAAAHWRPTVYITGDKATGKSTLQDLIKLLLGEYLIQAVDTTAAGLYQHIGMDCLACAVDEIEGEADVRKAKAVLKLARIAAKGGLMLRGGDRHNPVDFVARSAFLFSSINTPPLEPQDLSRMAILRLKRLQPGVPPPDLDPQVLAVVGRCILTRMMQEWPRYSQTVAAFKDELAKGGMDSRGGDVFGTLLACADMIEHDGWNAERVNLLIGDSQLVSVSELMNVSLMAEFEDAAENWRLCLSHLLGVRIDAWRSGTRTAVGQVLIDLWNGRGEMNESLARTMLAQCGLGLVRREGQRNWWLAVPNQNPLTRMLFEGSKWAGDVGAGVWAGALRQSPETVHAVAKARVNGDVQSCTLVSLKALYGAGGIMVMEGDQLE